jgi:hypothetical protein
MNLIIAGMEIDLGEHGSIELIKQVPYTGQWTIVTT